MILVQQNVMCDKTAQLFNQKSIENEISPPLLRDFDLFALTVLSAAFSAQSEQTADLIDSAPPSIS